MSKPKAFVLETGSHSISQISFSPDGNWIAGGGGLFEQPACILIWDALSLKLHRTLEQKEKETICALKFSPVSTVLASSCWPDTDIQLWKLPTMDEFGKLALKSTSARSVVGVPRDETVVGGLTFSSDGELLAAGCWDRRVKVWNIKRGTLRELEPRHKDNVDFVAFLKTGGSLISGTADVLWVWNLEAHKLVKKIQIRSDEYVWKHVLSLDNHTLFSIGNKGTIRVWNLDSWKYKEFSLKTKKPGVIAVAPDGRTLAIGFNDGEIVFWSTSSYEKSSRLKLAHCIASLAYSPSGSHLAVVQLSKDQKRHVHLYSLTV